LPRTHEPSKPVSGSPPESLDRSPESLDRPTESLDRPLNATYVRVVVVEAVIILLLWLFGRMFS
jgi:hypothetical protein